MKLETCEQFEFDNKSFQSAYEQFYWPEETGDWKDWADNSL